MMPGGVAMTQTAVGLLGVLLLLSGGGGAQARNQHDAHDFDVLIFTQQWPVTTCIEWKDQNAQHTCLLPSAKEMWTIHGVWPTRLGTIGPSFCNKTAVFDPDQLAPFEDQLRQFWINIEKGQSLWKHEWLKHGTCASILPELNSEHKYFGRGLSWLHQYSMSSILDQSNIQPDNPELTVETVHGAVVGALQKRPYIRCLLDRKSGISYLSEIRICFAKNLTLVDCDGVREGLESSDESDESNESYEYLDGDGDGAISTNCLRGQLIVYPSVVPPSRLLAAEQRPPTQAVDGKPASATKVPAWRFPWVDVYKLLSLIRSATL